MAIRNWAIGELVSELMKDAPAPRIGAEFSFVFHDINEIP
jgi:hypothetical protein